MFTYLNKQKQQEAKYRTMWNSTCCNNSPIHQLWVQWSKRRGLDLTHSSHLLQLLQETKAFTSLMSDMVSPACSGHVWTTSPGRQPRDILIRCPNHFKLLLSLWRNSSSRYWEEMLPQVEKFNFFQGFVYKWDKNGAGDWQVVWIIGKRSGSCLWLQIVQHNTRILWPLLPVMSPYFFFGQSLIGPHGWRPNYQVLAKWSHL